MYMYIAYRHLYMLIYLPPISSISINEIEYILSFYYKAFNMTYP